MKQTLKWLSLAFAAGVALLWLLWLAWPGMPGRSVQRDILLTRLQQLQRLEVLQAQLLAHQQVRDPGLLSGSEFLIVAKGRAIYGVDLSQARFDNNSGQLKLPPVSVLELIVDPADVDYIGIKKGLLLRQQSFEETKREALIELHRALQQQARSPELLAEAEASLRNYVTGWLDSLGHGQIEIVFGSALQ